VKPCGLRTAALVAMAHSQVSEAVCSKIEILAFTVVKRAHAAASLLRFRGRNRGIRYLRALVFGSRLVKFAHDSNGPALICVRISKRHI
jgi:hypothetical protein